MAKKIKIGKLPAGYHMMPDGRIMRDSDHQMMHGGNVLRSVGGDASYNLEAEDGETIVTDKTGDGLIEHYAIKGKRHSEGGVNMNEKPNSFIFSDTPKMKLGKELNSFFNKSESKSYTPAEIAKQYLDMNDDKRMLMNPFADDLERTTAGLNMFNKTYKLGGLAMAQEAKKGFPDGIPVIAQLYAQLNGIATGDNTMPAGMQQAKYGAEVKKFQQAGQYRPDQPVYIQGQRYYYQSTEDNPGWFTGDTITLKDPVSGKTFKVDKDVYDQYAASEGTYISPTGVTPFPQQYYSSGLPPQVKQRQVIDFGFSPEHSKSGQNKLIREGQEFRKGDVVYYHNKPFKIVDPFGFSNSPQATVNAYAPPYPGGYYQPLEGSSMIVSPIDITYDAQGNPVQTVSGNYSYIPYRYITEDNFTRKSATTTQSTSSSKPKTASSTQMTVNQAVQQQQQPSQRSTQSLISTGHTVDSTEVYKVGGESGGGDPIYPVKDPSGKVVGYTYKGVVYDTVEEAKAKRNSESKKPEGSGSKSSDGKSTGFNTSKLTDDQKQAYQTLKPYVKGTTSKGKLIIKLPSDVSWEDKQLAAAASTILGFDNIVQNSTYDKGSKEGYSRYFAGVTPEDYERKIVEQYDGVSASGMSGSDVRKRAFEIMGLDANEETLGKSTEELYGNKDWLNQTFYPAFTKFLPEGAYRPDLGDDFKFGLEHLDAIKPKTPPPPPTPGDPPSVYWCVDGNIVATENAQSTPSGESVRGPFSTSEEATTNCSEKPPGTPPKKRKSFDVLPFPQDVINLAVANAIPLQKFPSWAPTVATPYMEAPFMDPRYINAAIQGTAQQAMDASNAFAGSPSVARAANAMYQGQSADQQIKNISGVGLENVRIAGDVAYKNAMNKAKTDLVNAQMQKTRYDQNVLAADNFLKEKGMKNVAVGEALKGMITNRAMAMNFPKIFPQYGVDTWRGGVIDFTDAYAQQRLNPRQSANIPSFQEFKNQYPDVSADKAFDAYSKRYINSGVTADQMDPNMAALLYLQKMMS